MKKLNQNNTIATTAMQTKTNTMKDKTNILFRLTFIVFFIFFVFSNIWGWSAAPVKVGKTWYSFNENNTNIQYKIGGISPGSGTVVEKDVYSPCSNYVKVDFYHDSGLGSPDFYSFENANSSNFDKVSVNGGDRHKKWFTSYFAKSSGDLLGMYHLKITRGYSTYDGYVRNIIIELYPHIRLYDSTNGNSNRDGGTTNLTINETNDPTHAKVGQAKEIIIPFRSFLTSGNITVKMANGDPNVFRVNNSTTDCTTTQSFPVYSGGANKCGTMEGTGDYTNTPGSATACNIHVFFYPQNTTQQSATFTITDGTSTATATINAIGEDNSMSFETNVNIPSESQSFEMTNFLGNVTVSVPSPFQVSIDNSTWQNSIQVGNDKTYYVRFYPTTANADEQIYNDVVTMTSNDTTYNLNVSGKAKKQQATISWNVPQQDLILPLNSIYPLNATFVGDPVTQYSTNDPSVIDIVQNNGVYYIEAKGAAGQSATITASANGTDVYTKPADISYNFRISPKMVQYIKWDQDLSKLKMASKSTPLQVTLMAMACDKGSETDNTNSITYSCSTDKTNYTDIPGNTITFHDKGTYYLKAYTAETGDDQSGYLSAEMVRTVIVRIEGESCPQYSLMPTDINSSNDVPCNLNGLPGTMSGTLYYGMVTQVNVTINPNSLWHYAYGGLDDWTWGSSGNQPISATTDKMQNYSSITVHSNHGNFNNDKLKIEGLTVTQQTYFNKGGAANNTIPFGDVTVGVTSGAQTFTLNFANVPEIEIVPTSGNTDQFTVTRTNVSSKNKVGGPDVNTVECNCFGNATYSVTFHPTSSGDKRAEYIFKAAIEGADGGYVEFKLTVTGKGTRKSQSLSWDNSHSLFTTSLNALSGTIDLIGAAVSYDGSNPTGLTPTYSLSNVTPAGAVELTDNGTKLKINTYGSFVLNANQSGEGSNYEAAQTLTHEAINISRVTPHLAWVTTPDNSTEVFQMVTVSAATNDTQGEIGNITYSFEPASAGSVTNDGQLTLINREAATLYATISETGTYSAGTIPHTFTPAKVTPVLQCSIQSLERTALTDLYLTEMPVTITNSTTLWHDIAVTYSSNNESIAKFEGDHFSLLKSGNCTITAKVNAGVNNNASSNTIEIQLTVDSASQSITWNDDLTGPYNVNQAAVGPLTATASSGMTVNYSDGGKGIVSIGSDNKISFLKAGYVTITASQSGDERYSAAGNVTKNFKVDFEVGKTFTFTGENVLVDGSKEETFDMTGLFVSSGESYTVTSSSPEFIIENATITSNKITIKFEPKTIETDNDTEEKTSTITITDNGQTYSFKVKATAEKKNAGLTLSSDEGETFAFSTITLSHSEATDAKVTLSASIGNIEDNTYKFQSTAPVTITATVLANNKFKADSKTLNFTPKAVTPKIINWSGSYGAQKVGVSCPLGQADWEVDETVSEQPEKKEWGKEEVTITYSSSNEDIARINGTNLEFGKAGVATITASIIAEKSHNAAESQTKSVKVDFADAGVNCGTAYAGETPAVADITDMIASAGAISYLKDHATSTNLEFKVNVNNNRLEVVFDPSSYHEETSTAIITFTDTDGEVYNLNVQGECQKHTPVIEWRSDVQTIAIAQDENDIKTETDLIDATNSQYYQPLKFKSSDTSKVIVYDESYAEAEWGIYVYPIGKGSVTIYAKAEETESHYASTEASEKQFTVIGVAKSKIEWNQNFTRIYNDEVSKTLTAQVQDYVNSSPIDGATVIYHLIDIENDVVRLNNDTLSITSGKTGTAKIYAEFAGNGDYIGCVSETLNINVVAKVTGSCNNIKYDDVKSQETYYYFNNSRTSPGEPYFEVELIKCYATAKGDKGGGIISGAGATRTIRSELESGPSKYTDGPGGSRGTFSGQEATPIGQEHTYLENEIVGKPTFIRFSGDIGKNGSNTFTNIEVTPKSYFRKDNSWSNPFVTGDSTEVGKSRKERFLIGTYSNLSDYTIELLDTNSNSYSDQEFTIVSSEGPQGCLDNNTVDFGEWYITVEFKPKSGKHEKKHKCKIKITYTKGSTGEGNFQEIFDIEAFAKRIDQGEIIWNQNLSGLTSLSTKPNGDDWISIDPIILTAKSALSDTYGTYVGVDEYSITNGNDVAEVENNELSIKKAGSVTIKAVHNGNDQYNPQSKEMTISINKITPTIVLTNDNSLIAEGSTINVTYNDQPITIGGKALYGDFEIYGYNVGGKIQLSSSVPDVVAIANGNQLRFEKSGDAVITATIDEDDVVYEKTFTFNVHVNRAAAGLHWDDEQKYVDDWMYVFDTKKMTALPGNIENKEIITYEVTSGVADIDADGNITPHSCETITVKARIAETEKYLADEKNITFKPAMVTPVVTWKNNNVYLTTDKSHNTYTIADNDLATVSAKVQNPEQPSIEDWYDGKEITYSVEEGDEVITLQGGHTFTINKVGYAMIKAQVIGEDNHNASEDNPTRHLKVDFDPNKPIYCGEAVVFSSCSKTVNLGDSMAIEGNITANNPSNNEFGAVLDQNTNELTITYKPQSIKETNPTEGIVPITGANGIQYSLHVTGKALPYKPIFLVSKNKHDNWVFETTPNNAKSEITYGYNSGSDIYWSNTGGIDAGEASAELDKVQLSLKYDTDAEYVEIVDNGRNFRVKQAKADSDDDFTVVIVASYPGLEGKMEPSSVEIPITIRKTQYQLDWHNTEVTIYANEQNVKQGKPTLSPSGGVSTVQYSYSKEGVISYDETTDTITLTEEGKKESSVMLIATVASDIYGKGTRASITVTIKKKNQFIDWSTEDISDFTTQRDTTLAMDLLAFAKFENPTKANIFYNVTEVSNCDGEGPLIRIDTIKTTTPYTHKLYYTGNGSGKVTIVATASGTDDFNPVQIGSTEAKTKEINITKEDCYVNSWTVNNMRYGDKVVLEPTVDKFTRGENYEYTLPTVTGTLDTAGNVLNVKGVGNGLTISAKKLEDCWVNASEGSTASNTFNIAKSEQEIEWDKTVLGTPQEGAYHFGVLDGNAYQLATQAIDTLHKDAAATWLSLEDGKYVTANVSGGAPGELSLVYSIVEQDVCKVGEDKIVSVDNEGKMHITGNGTGTVLVIASVDGRDYYENVSETITVVVDKVTPTISVTNQPTATDVHFGDAAWTSLAATAQVGGNDVYTDYYMLGSEGHINLSSSDVDVVSITENKDLQFNKAGQATIAAKIQDNDCRMNDAETTFVVTVQKTDQIIKYTTIDDVNTGQYANPIVIDLNNHFTAYDESHSKATGGTIVYEVTITPDEGCSGITFDNQHTITIDGTGSGSVSIKATQDGTDASGNTNYIAAETTQSFLVNKITPTITLDAISGTIHYGDEITLHAIASCTDYADDSNNSGTKIKFKYSGKEIIDNTFTVDDADGKLTVQAFMDADCQINSTASAVAEYDIALTDQEIVWNQSDMESSYTTLDNNQFTLDAYAIDAVHKTTEIKTGAEIVYDFVLEPDDNNCGDIATLSNGVLTLTGAGSGTVTVKAKCQGVDGKYSPVTTAVEKTLTITKVDPEVTMNTIANVTCGATGTLGATANHGGNEGFTFESSNTDTATVLGNSFTALHAGTVRFRVTKAATCTTIEKTSVYAQAVIDKADQTVTWNNNPATETLLATDMTNGITLSATATSNITHQATGTEISYSITSGGNLAKIENDKLVSLGAGTGQVTVLATAGTTAYRYEDYNEASQEITFSVVPDNITFTIAQLDLTYGDVDMAFNVTNDKGLTESQYTMTITKIDGKNIQTNATNQTHIDAIHASNGQLTVGLEFSGMANYADVKTTAVVTVAKASQTITWDQTFDGQYDIFSKIFFNATSNADASGQNNVYYTWTQNSTCQNPVFSGDANNVISYDATDGAPILAAGVVTITANHRGNENYQPGTSDSKTFTISEATPTLTWGTEYTSNQNTNDVIQLEATSNYAESPVQYEIVSLTVEGCASINGNQLTCNAPGTVVVKAYQDAIPCVIQRSEIQQNIKIGNGPHTITWTADSYNYKNTDGKIDLSSLCTCATGVILFSSSRPDIATVSDNSLIINEITTSENVVITASVAATDEYEAATECRTFSISVETLTITIIGGTYENPIDLGSTQTKVTSVTTGVDFEQLLKVENILSSNYNNVSYTFVSEKPNFATFAEDGKTIIVYKKANKLKITVTARVEGIENPAVGELYVDIPRGVMKFKNDGNWHENGKWVRTDMLPSAEDHDVSIQANCIIQDDSTAVCYNLNITDSGSLSVSPNAVLDVTDTITNSEASKLTLKANENHSATVLFATGSPSATVENYIQGGLHSEGEGENKINNPDWQYRGFVGNNPSLSGVWNVVIFKWNEALNSTNCWGESPVYEMSGNYTFSPWDGYCMANYDGEHEREYTSKLIPSDTTMTYHLSYTDHGQQYPNRGVNLITNSWSAPIDMSSSAVTFEGDDEATFYFYTTMNHKAWENKRMKSFVTYPQKSGEAVNEVSSLIAAGQSFLVKTKVNGRKLTIGSAALAREANGKMYAPAEKERFNVLSITMSNDTMADRLFLLESENCSRAFDNGYDGTKIKEGNMPQIFASNDFGHTAVNTDKTMLGQRIGYSAAKDGALCTITFNTERLDGFSELYLYDRVARRYANILAGDSYSFTGTKAGEEERFEIVGRRDDGSEFVTSSDMMIEVIGNRALLSGFAGGNDEVFITDMNGKRLWTERASNGPWFELPNLPAGVYLINCGEANCKFIVK